MFGKKLKGKRSQMAGVPYETISYSDSVEFAIIKIVF